MAGRGMFGRVREALFPSRKAPVQSTTQAEHVRDKLFGGSTRAMAAAYGVSQRTVERWIKGTRTPPELSRAAERRWEKENAARAKQGRPPLPRPTTAADKLANDAVRAQTTERGRQRKARQMQQLGVGAFSGYTARVGRANTFKVQGSDAVRSATSTSTSPATRPPPSPSRRTRTRCGTSSARPSPTTSTAASSAASPPMPRS